MTNRRRRFSSRSATGFASAILLAVAMGAGTAAAEGPTPGEAAAEAAKESAERAGDAARDAAETKAADAMADIIRFVPPSRGKAKHSAAGGTRGSSPGRGLQVAVVAPAEGFTTRAQPVLYWYLSSGTDDRIDVVLTDDDAIDPLLEVTLPTPVAAGIHGLDLARHGVSLEPGRTYRWSVSVVQDPKRRSNDIMTEGLIERTGPSASLTRSLEAAPLRFAPYALSGIWYDALAELRVALEANPQDRGLRRQEVALLEQIELPEVARYARAQAR